MTHDVMNFSEEEFAARINGRIAVITGITFPESNSGHNVCVHCTLWDDEFDHLHNLSVEYKNIFTKRKNIFQSFCEDFQIYNNGNLDFSGIIGLLCIVDHHCIYGPMVYAIFEDDDIDEKLLNTATTRLQKAKIQQNIDDLPNDLWYYWRCPKLDTENLRDRIYHGIITGIEQIPTTENDCKTIIRVAVFLNGKPVVIPHYINSQYNSELDNLVEMYGDGEYLESILYQQVDVKLFQTSSKKIYVGPILRPSYGTASEKKQVKLLANDYKQFVIQPENVAFDYNER